MSTSKALKEICTLARPMIEQQLDLTMEIAVIRDLATAKGLDWSQIKALLKAQIQDERDDSGDGKRVKRIVEKAEFASAYADMLGLANMNENNYFAGDDDEAEEITEPQPAPQAESDLTEVPPANNSGQVADIQEPQPETAEQQHDDHAAGDQGEAPRPLAADIQPETASELQKAAGATTQSDQPDARPEGLPEISGNPEATPMYAEPGIITWESCPPEGVERHQYSAAFGDLGQDIEVITEDMEQARSEPIVKLGKVIIDGWARFMKARDLGIEYPVVQYAGVDPLVDCIKLNVDGRILTNQHKQIIAKRLIELHPQRKGIILSHLSGEGYEA